MKYLILGRLRHRGPVLALLAVLAVVASPCFAQDECFEFDPPLLFDTSDNSTASPYNPRVMGIKLFYWNGKTNLIYNTGNELSIVDISNPTSPQPRGSTCAGRWRPAPPFCQS